MKKDALIMFIIYELGQVDELKKYFSKKPEDKNSSIIVALSIDIEQKLLREHIPFISAGSYKKVFLDQLSDEDEMMYKFFDHTRWEDFVYRDIYLPKIFQFMFRAYLQIVRYHGMQLMRITESHPEVRELKVFPPSEVLTKTYGTLASRELNVVADCAKRIGDIRGIPVTVIPLTVVLTSFRKSLQPLIFSAKRTIFSCAIKAWNVFVTVVVRPRNTRFLISDHWKNIKSFAKLLTNEEFIFLDRSEVRHIPWRLLFRHRMRFVHAADFIPRKAVQRVRDHSRMLQETWCKTRKNIPQTFVWNNCSFDELLLRAVDDIVLDFPKILSEIEGTCALYGKLRPNVVKLRASVSKQPHFSILPLVAKRCGIPSLELQHGLEYLGPGSWSREHLAEYIAVYGPLVRQELVSIGYDEEKLVEIGSPRFDGNIRAASISRNTHRQNKKFTILCIAPDIRAFEVYDSYSASEYFASIARAAGLEKENIHFVVKLRPGPADEALLRGITSRLFSHFSYTVAQYEPLSQLYTNADAVISCFSTVIVEALQFGLPVIIPALHPVDAKIVQFHFSQYSEAGALLVVCTPMEFSQAISSLVHDERRRDEIRRNIDVFMTKNFCFDGKSSERYATLMSELAKPH